MSKAVKDDVKEGDLVWAKHAVSRLSSTAVFAWRTMVELSEATSKCAVASAMALEPEIQLQELQAAWEDRLDALGSEPVLASLGRLLEEAPSRDDEMFIYALDYYNERLLAALDAWEAELDAMGAWPASEDLEKMILKCPDKGLPSAVFAAGVLAQRLADR